MNANTRRTVGVQSRTRGSCAWGAAAALLSLALLLCPGCDDSIRQELRQGAFEVFEAGVDTFYDELGGGLVDAIEDLGSDVAGGGG